jgi:hypothetical protein
MIKWEYKIVVCAIHDLQRTLNFYGKEGWELCGAPDLEDNGMAYLTFKRPISDDNLLLETNNLQLD